MSDIASGVAGRTPVMLSEQERSTIAAALHLGAELQAGLGHPDRARTAHELADRIAPIRDDDQERDITRAQECAADGIAALYGRAAVRHQADGSIVVTGLTDDVERATVCFEQDGQERWRR